ncbi:MAG TPA: 3,4-dihydroxy-2-butanone-4-phosphate synthase [Gammaproteobacteria bacterium]|nr:3,4-dihydroxy-2-butanone-4-phosphate synthase [Gammaproteobacteria bacterium]
MALNTTEEIIEDIRQGKMVVIMDDEDRENEGDLIMAAEKVRPDDINFMATNGRGLICLTLTPERCQQLRLPMMVNDNNAMHSTAFTVSVEAAEGVTTGISAADRAVTIQAAVARDATPEDLVQPGHIFPLLAEPGGVLTRAGHTEAGCDFTRLAGCEPAAAIVEILNEDGSMARRPDLEKFASEHGLKMGTIADLIHYRVSNEKTVERVAERKIDTEHGDFQLVAYHDTIDEELHFALVKGEINSDEPVTVRVHMQNTLCDVVGSLNHGCSWSLHAAMAYIEKEGKGIVVILRGNENNQELLRKIKNSTEAEKKGKKNAQGAMELRTYGVGAQILSDLGVRKMRILSSPIIMHGLSGFDLEVVEYIAGE